MTSSHTGRRSRARGPPRHLPDTWTRRERRARRRTRRACGCCRRWLRRGDRGGRRRRARPARSRGARACSSDARRAARPARRRRVRLRIPTTRHPLAGGDARLRERREAALDGEAQPSDCSTSRSVCRAGLPRCAPTAVGRRRPRREQSLVVVPDQFCCRTPMSGGRAVRNRHQPLHGARDHGRGVGNATDLRDLMSGRGARRGLRRREPLHALWNRGSE